MNLNAKQIISIIGAILSVLMISTAQLTDLMGPAAAKSIVSIAGLGNMVLSSVMAALTSQRSTVQDVQAMVGVERIRINENANPTLAAMAVDPANTKILPTPEAQAAITATAVAKGP